MEILTMGLLVVVAAGLLVVVLSRLPVRGHLQSAPELASSLLALQQRFDSLNQRLDQRLDAVNQSLNGSLAASNQTILRIGDQLGALGKSSERMLEVGQDIAALQDILRPPKLRGGLGELLLERLLLQVVPDAYTLQHRFRGGEIVDAVIRMGPGLVPVDAKFPLDSFARMRAAPDEEQRGRRRDFERAVRGHVDAVARYIRADEGTYDFAVMYVPAENVYYELLTTEGDQSTEGGIIAYAQGRRVVLASPSTFYAYLASIALGLRGLRVEERAREISGHVQRLTSEFAAFREGFDTLGGHIDRAQRKHTELSAHAARFDARLAQPLLGTGKEESPVHQQGARL